MKLIVGPILASLSAVSVTGTVAAQDSQKEQTVDLAELAEARAIMEIMFPPGDRDQTFSNLIKQILDQFRQGIPASALSDPGTEEILNRYFESLPNRLMPLVSKHLPMIIDATAHAYTHEFTLEELQAIHAFAETQAGGHYLVRSSALIGDPDVAAANTAYFAEIQSLQQALRQELQKELITYLADHPDVAEEIVRENESK